MAELGGNIENDGFSEDEDDLDWNTVTGYDEEIVNQIFPVFNVNRDAVSLENDCVLGLGQSDNITGSQVPDSTCDEEERTTNANPVQRMALNDHKAGMQGLDKEKINQIIFEASKGSKFYENEKKKESRVAEKIKSLKELMQTFTDLDYKKAKKEANNFVRSIEFERNLSRIIVHIDMDAFYAAVETRDNPALKDIPMAVGSNSMLSTSNYAARRYGVRAAMPGFIARKLCPSLTIVPLNFKKYREVSDQVKKIIAAYDPNFSGMGLDEAYLDLTDFINDICHNKQTIASLKDMTETNDDACCENDSSILTKRQLVEKTVQELREKIFKETKLTASAGIACNVMLAKVCSDMNKPNGQFYLPAEKEAVLNFVNELPIRKVFGIGRVSEQILNEFGITKCKDLYDKRALLYLLFSPISFQHFMKISRGISSCILDNESERKSLSSETTFNETSDPEKIYKICHDLCESVSNDLQKENLTGKCITVKFKLANFEVKTRAKTLTDYIDTTEEIFKVAKDIIHAQIKFSHPEKLRLRLLGVRVSEFGEKKKCVQNKLDAFLSIAGKNTKEGTSDKDSLIDTACSTTEEKVKESRNVHSEKLVNSVNCPICQTSQLVDDINAHIDSCLNKQAIRKLVSEDSKLSKSKNENSGKGSKRKFVSVNGETKSCKRKTLQSFWKEK